MSTDYLEKIKKIQATFLLYIDDDENIELHYKFLLKLFTDESISDDLPAFKLLLRFICSISNNHHRTPYFFHKIDKILQFFKEDFDYYFTNSEIFNIFKSNKRILLFLLKEKIITMDNHIAKKMLSSKYKDANYPQYFYPEIKYVMPFETIENIPKDVQQSFEEKRKIGENDSSICKLIQNDDVVKFIGWTNYSNLSLSKTKIETSIYETNAFLMDKTPTLIEYAAFYGSIQIFRYLTMNRVQLTSSLWLYAIHGQNAEIIHILEENHVIPEDKTYDKCLEESIRCNHNEFAVYIEDNLLVKTNEKKVEMKISLNVAMSCFNSYNYECFPSDFNNKIMFYNKEFHNAARKNQNEIILLLLSYLGIDIEPIFYTGKTKLAQISIDIAKTGDESFDGIINIVKLGLDPILTSAFDSFASLDHLIISTTRTTIEECNVNREGDIRHVTISPRITASTIETSLFKGCAKLTQITIPPSIEIIEQSAFEGCTSLSQVVIPTSVAWIGDSAFYGCSSLVQVEIPESITTIENYTFFGCTSLTQITIPSSVVRIGDSAFRGCSSLKQFTIPSTLTTIEPYTFYGCSSLEEITIPTSVTRIKTCAFKRCTLLAKITIPPTVKVIESYAFYRCSSLNNVVIPPSITKIDSYTFYGCTSLTDISIPSSVMSIESNAFFVCSSLEQLSIPSSVTSIESYTFCGCCSLKEIKIPSFVNLIGEDAFFKCSSLTQISIPSSVTSIESFTFCECSSLKEISIPNSVKSIGNSAFRDCCSLMKISIPPSITLLEHHVFYGCSSLKEIMIPSSVTLIEDHAFYGCSSLKNLTIPTSVTEIGDEALFKCTSLIKLTIPFTIQVSRIGIDSNIIVKLV